MLLCNIFCSTLVYVAKMFLLMLEDSFSVGFVLLLFQCLVVGDDIRTDDGTSANGRNSKYLHLIGVLGSTGVFKKREIDFFCVQFFDVLHVHFVLRSSIDGGG